MNGGDPILGGGQANPNPGNTQSTPPGPQPAPSAIPTTTPSQAPTPMPQVPQSPVNTAPTPVNATQSPDSFSSFSTQPSRPIAPPRIPTYGNSFSRPTVGRPSFPASRPIDQPINPMTPNGIINGSQMSPSALPSSDQVVFSDTGATSATSSGKGKKIAIIILFLLLVAGGVVAALFATGVLGGNQSTSNSSQSDGTLSTKKEVYEALFNFNEDNYSTLMLYYDDQVGFTPHLALTEESIIFPITRDWHLLTDSYNETLTVYNDISSKIPDKVPDTNLDLATTKKDIDNSLQDIKRNIDFIQKIYDVYIFSAIDESRPTTCSKTTDMISLEQGNNSEVASKFFILHCDLLNLINTHGGRPEEISPEMAQKALSVSAADATSALNSSLTTVHPATTSINYSLEELFDE